MANNEVLYMKGMNLSESDLDEEEEDIWDDRMLNNAYDKALKIANAEVAKRIAMSTNSQAKETHPEETNRNTNDVSKSHLSKSCSKKQLLHWRAGMHCRAVYGFDGVEYEAIMLEFINDHECVVKFIGYDNTEIVAINSLKQSLGKHERAKQEKDASLERSEDEGSERSVSDHAKMECSDRTYSGTSLDAPQNKKKSAKKKRSKQKTTHNFNLPDLPMPDLSKLRNGNQWGYMDMPIPPPPPMLSSSDGEEQTISSMLLSWYMSGYYTGLYQGMRRAKSQKK